MINSMDKLMPMFILLRLKYWKVLCKINDEQYVINKLEIIIIIILIIIIIKKSYIQYWNKIIFQEAEFSPGEK
jgi:hypothetical protein